MVLIWACSQGGFDPVTVSKSKDGSFYKEFGHLLFFDRQLSFNSTKSCSSCHDPKMSFTDGYRKSLGATADLHQRNSSSLLNIADYNYYTSADSTITLIEKQVLLPLFNNKVVELGLKGYEKEVLSRIKKDGNYQKLFVNHDQNIQHLDWQTIIHSIAEYCRALNSYNSKYDYFIKSNNNSVFSNQELNGMKLFNSDSLGCSGCHGGVNFNKPKQTNSSLFIANGFFKIDKSNVNTLFDDDKGLANISKENKDIGRFRVPSLRNVVITAPYLHDGSIKELKDLIRIYGQGGYLNSPKDKRIRTFSLTREETSDLIAFLGTLTDTTYLKDPFFLSPFGF